MCTVTITNNYDINIANNNLINVGGKKIYNNKSLHDTIGTITEHDDESN